MEKEAKEFLKQHQIVDIDFNDSCATVLDAANLLKVEEKAILKSMGFLVSGKPIIICLAGNYKVNNHKFISVFKEKPKMIPYEKTEELLGYIPGSVAPFLKKDGVQIFLDISIKQNETIYPSNGTKHGVAKISVQKFEEIVEYVRYIDVGNLK